MKIAYLMNTYPVTSATFIRGEIRQHEAAGWEILRFAVRRSGDPLVDAENRAEQARTRYLLDHPGRLLWGLAREAAANPCGVACAFAVCLRLARNAGGRLVAHAAYLLEAVALKRAARAAGVAHVHAHFSTNTAAVALLARRMGGPSYSFTAHGPTEFYDPAASSLALKTEHAAAVVAISHFARTQIVLAAGMAAWGKIHVVRCGVDLSDFEPSKAPFEAAAPIVCVGRLCVEKAQALIPAAVARAAGPGEAAPRVLLIGDGEARPLVEAEIARRGVGDRVTLLGWRANGEVREILGSARALLLPSFAEGLPVVLMEALARERPVITTAIAGVPELVDASCGWLVPAGDEAALAAALREAVATPPETLAAKGREGRVRVEQLHDAHANAERLRGVIAAVASG